ncbi:MAG: ROK family protein [Clostridiales bacterium]|jgi:glucokinase|nr:ROK family protein [Clostridiales bacterium]
MNYYIGVDLGGTNINTGVVDENFNIIGRSSVKTDLPKSPDEIANLIAKGAQTALADAKKDLSDISRVGIGMPGIIDAHKGTVVFASNFDFRDIPMAELVSKKLNVPVFIENDAKSAIYGEVLNGSAKGFKNVVMLMLGTGVGGGVIINDEIYAGFNNQGAELGHVGIFYGGEKCLCGHTGCIELYCSATALIRQTKKAMELNMDSLMWKMVDGDIDKVEGKTPFEAMKNGDKTAFNVVNQYLDYLGYAVVNYIHIFQPEVIIIGGGISLQGNVVTDYLENYAAKNALGYTKDSHTFLRTASLGNDAGIIGAAFLGNQ